MAPAHKVCRYNAVLNLPHNSGDSIAICSLCLTVKYAFKDITQKTRELVWATLIMMIGVAMHWNGQIDTRLEWKLQDSESLWLALSIHKSQTHHMLGQDKDHRFDELPIQSYIV